MWWFILGLVFGTCGFGMYHFYEKKRIHKQQVEEDMRFSGLVASTKDIIYYFEKVPGFRFRYMLPPLNQFFDDEMAKEAFVDPKKFFYLVHPDDLEMHWKKIRGEVDYNKPIVYRINDRKGGYTWYEEYTTPVYKNGEIVALQGIVRNIQEKVKLQEELEYRINHDDLTGLFNRGYFERKLSYYNDEFDAPVAIIICDLDELKYVNDTFGHKAGDSLIQTAANLLNELSSDTTIVARMGGDEYAILLTNTNKEEVADLVTLLNEKVNGYVMESLALSIKLSIGYTYSESSLHNMETILADADKDMYRNKKNRKRIKQR